ncbi:hypothetical protein OBO34_22190 [Clostridiales Family XIII bacterium ASD5510]|uniref:Uncharacterized protein n=2 Tax=Bacteria TaxID=2 RepID=A0A9J6QZY9_9FIRM|nr:hypothetical protein [Hominibacterium faecale]MCU7381028.1 hypothetical protein [Hominibacterium faecale]
MGYYINCPYFQGEKRMTITCEDTMRRFYDPADKKKWIRTYCENDWGKCVHSEGMSRLYAELEDSNLSDLLKRARQAEYKERAARRELKNINVEYGKRIVERDQAERERDAARSIAEKKHAQIKRLQSQVEHGQAVCDLQETLTAYVMHQCGLDKIDMQDFAKWCKEYVFAWEHQESTTTLHVKKDPEG